MKPRMILAKILVIVGLAGMLIGAIDPLEGSFVILPASGVAAAGVFLAGSRYRWLLGWSFVLIAFGVAAMMLLSMWGGIGGNSGHSMWWGLFVLPYPVGWILGLTGIVLRLIEISKGRAPSGEAGS